MDGEGCGNKAYPERNAPTGLLAGRAAATWFESLDEVWKPRAVKPARRARLAVMVLGVIVRGRMALETGKGGVRTDGWNLGNLGG